MRAIRASELGSFSYCQRAWWYQRQGVPSENSGQLESGQKFHQAHGRQVKLTVFFRWLAIALTVAGFLLLLWGLGR